MTPEINVKLTRQTQEEATAAEGSCPKIRCNLKNE